jgi:superfamily II DNA or RNA helicase
MKEKDLKISESKDLILATYEMVSEGLDIQALDTMIMCTPKAGINQTVGRILRKKPEEYENQPLIVDIIDQIPTTLFMGFARKKLYTQRNYEIKFHDIKENNIEKVWDYDYSKEVKIEKTKEGFIDSDSEDDKDKAFKLLENNNDLNKCKLEKKIVTNKDLKKNIKKIKSNDGFIDD